MRKESKLLAKILAGVGASLVIGVIVGMSIKTTTAYSDSKEDMLVSSATVTTTVETPVVEEPEESSIDTTLYISKSELQGYTDDYMMMAGEVNYTVFLELSRLTDKATTANGGYISRSEYNDLKAKEQLWNQAYDAAYYAKPSYDELYSMVYARMEELYGTYFTLEYAEDQQIEIYQNKNDFTFRYGITIKDTTVFDYGGELRTTKVWIDTTLDISTMSSTKDYVKDETMMYDYGTMTRAAEDLFWKSNGLTMNDETYLLIRDNLDIPINPVQLIGYLDDFSMPAYIVDFDVVESNYAINSLTGENRWISDDQKGICRVLFNEKKEVLAYFMKETY